MNKAGIYSQYFDNVIAFYPLSDDLIGNYTITFYLFNITTKKRFQQTFDLKVIVKKYMDA